MNGVPESLSALLDEAAVLAARVRSKLDELNIQSPEARATVLRRVAVEFVEDSDE